MSLINDALKRASKAPPPPPPIDGGSAFRLAEQPVRSLVPALAISLIALAIFGLAGWFLYRGWQASRAGASSRAKTTVAARETAGDNRAGNESSLSALNSVKPHAPSQTTSTAGTATNVASATADPTKPALAPLKLNAIFYRAGNPSVVVNSKTLYIGDKAAQAKVLAIDRESVTLERGGQTNVLTLE